MGLAPLCGRHLSVAVTAVGKRQKTPMPRKNADLKTALILQFAIFLSE